jgi:hypothetical protein
MAQVTVFRLGNIGNPCCPCTPTPTPTVTVCGTAGTPVTLPTTLNFTDATLGVSGTGTWNAISGLFSGSVNYNYPGACANYFRPGSPACPATTVVVTYTLFPKVIGGSCCFTLGIGWLVDSGSGCPGGDQMTEAGCVATTCIFATPPTFSVAANVPDGCPSCTQTMLDGCPGAPGACDTNNFVTWSQ